MSSADCIGIISRADAVKLLNGNDVPNRKPVAKIDRAGGVIMIYPSIQAAADENNISRSAMSKRCGNKIGNPLLLKDYTFKYFVWLDERIPMADEETADADL